MSFTQLRYVAYQSHSVQFMASRKLPRLMGVGEIRARLGFSRQWATVVVNRKDFPDPVLVLEMGRIWLAEDVEKWAREHQGDASEES
jgi:prophage regulatory protein